MVKYIVPIIGSGTLDDPFRPKYEIDRKKYKCRFHYDLPNGVVVIESKEKIPVLEDKEDVKKE